MATYTGAVINNTDNTVKTNPDFPFMAIVTDAAGKVVGEFPVRTKADGEAKIMETLRELGDLASHTHDGPAKA
jgi:hypothetical protein